MKNHLILFIGLCLSIIACNSQTTEQQTITTAETPATKIVPTAQPATIKSGVPIYETFDQLAPIFEQQNDTTYIINFWSTWCKPCVEELPYFEQLHDQFKGQKYKVILVSLDFPKQFDSKLIPFLEKQQLQSDVVLLADGQYNNWIDRVDPEWSGAIPITVVYRGDKRQFHGEQFPNYEALSEFVQSVM